MTNRVVSVTAALLLLAAVCSSSGWAHGGREEGKAAPDVATGSSDAASLYEPPAPGTYALPPIVRVHDHALLGGDGKPASLLDLGADQAAIVSFIYQSCGQATGCPLALSTLQRLDRALAERAGLARRVRLVTVSFDPDHDTPDRMKALRALMDPKCDWRFLTAGSRKALSPLLDDFGQDAVPLVTEEGKETGQYRHVLKVFLVDGRKDVRNIYSTGFMDERLLLNDLMTVLEMSEGRAITD